MSVHPCPRRRPRRSRGPIRRRSAPATGSCSSGQLGLDPDGALVAGGIEAEARQALSNVAAVLADCGAEWADVAKVAIFLTDLGEFPP